jgi:hypothetical protein
MKNELDLSAAPSAKVGSLSALNPHRFSPSLAFVALLDALGAKNYSREQVATFLGVRDQILADAAKVTDKPHFALEKKNFRIFVFNDTVIFAYLIDRWTAAALNDFCGLIRGVHTAFRLSNIFFRGAISLGVLYEANDKQNTIMGPALSDAAAWPKTVYLAHGKDPKRARADLFTRFAALSIPDGTESKCAAFVMVVTPLIWVAQASPEFSPVAYISKPPGTRSYRMAEPTTSTTVRVVANTWPKQRTHNYSARPASAWRLFRIDRHDEVLGLFDSMPVIRCGVRLGTSSSRTPSYSVRRAGMQCRLHR